MCEHIIHRIAEVIVTEGRGSLDYSRAVDYAEAVLDDLMETQVINFSYAEADGCQYKYSDLEELTTELGMLINDYSDFRWPIFMEIQFREPTCYLQFKDGRPEISV